MQLHDFDFSLPEHLIATQPLAQRDQSRLLHLHDNTLSDRIFTDFLKLLTPNDVLVFNNTKVIPAELTATRTRDGNTATLRINLHQKQSDTQWLAFVKPAKKIQTGDILTFGDDFTANITQKREDGEIRLEFLCPPDLISQKLDEYGRMPLPPYMKRQASNEDKNSYQTVYAEHEGAVAAPTAGLHFTQSLLDELRQKGVEQHHVTLHVGAGTFLPVKVDNIADHIMHSEYCTITQHTADAINTAKQQGKRIIAVGTTSLRTLESMTDDTGILQAGDMHTDIFITPGYNFKMIDGLITNFHLPKSTLFMLVSALMGLETMQTAYAHAIDKNYRFYSYGDACFLDKQTQPNNR